MGFSSSLATAARNRAAELARAAAASARRGSGELATRNHTVRMTDIVRALKTATGAPADPTDLARISPLAHAHVIPSGTYHFERATTEHEARPAS